ncbi:MAG: dihydroorotate dehydrogenase [Clostridiales bacterium]|nr:dihydroorotate dehydrogenase [Clostridiales bacterium]
MVDLSVKLGSVCLDNPVVPASGTFGYGQEFSNFYDINILGSFSFKGTTEEARFGNETPRIAETRAGMLNSVGLQNPGVQHVMQHELPQLKKIYKKGVIANVSGFSVKEYVNVAAALDAADNVSVIEVNISCPNVHGGGMSFGTSAKSAYEVTRAVKDAVKKPVFIKLSPNVTDITEIATACEAAGADGLTLINTLLGMRIDIKTRRTVLANKTGGFSGGAIFPVALRMVYQTAKKCKIPIMGCGGVESADDVIEMMMAGATAVQVGAANLVNPYAAKEIIEALPEKCRELSISKISDIIGAAE